MKLHRLFVACALLLPSVAIGDDVFEVRILAHPSEIPFGITEIPFLWEVRNVSGHPVTVAQLWTDTKQTGPTGAVKGADPAGWFDCTSGLSHEVPAAKLFDTDEPRTLPPGWSLVREGGVWCSRWPTQVRVHVAVGSHPAAGVETWTGDVDSPEFTITFQPPVGVDKLAYDAFGGRPMEPSGKGALLRDYPKSTYAAWAVFRSMCCGAAPASDPSLVLESVANHDREGLRRWASLPDAVKGGGQSLWGDDVGTWCDEWTTRVLDAHPDIWFSDQLRLGKALNAIWLKDYAAATDVLRSVEKDAKVRFIAERAQQYLSLMAERGMAPVVEGPQAAPAREVAPPGGTPKGR